MTKSQIDNQSQGNQHENPPPISPKHLRTGSSLSIERLIAGHYGKDLVQVERLSHAYRRRLEDVVAAERGEVDLEMAHAIDEATGYESLGGICRWILRRKWKSLKPGEILTCCKTLAESKTKRNEAFRQLKLGATDHTVDVIATIYDANDDETPSESDKNGPETRASNQSASSDPSDQNARESGR